MKPEKKQLIIALITTIVCLIFLYYICGWILSKILAIDTAKLSVLLSFITATGTIGGLFYTQYQTKRREIESKHFSEKQRVYSGVFKIIDDLMKSTKAEQQIPQETLISQMREINNGLMVWGSKEVIQLWSYLIKTSTEETSNFLNQMRKWEKIYRTLRKDLGHNDKFNDEFAIVRLLLNPEAQAQLDQLLQQEKSINS